MSPGNPESEHAFLSLAEIPEHELIAPIASGAYGQVWIARNQLGVRRAVKIVHRTNFEHDRPFEREFAGIKAFEPVSRSHEGLVDLLQVGRDDSAGYFYYVMELADDLNGDFRMEDPKSTMAPPHPDTYLPRTLASELKRRGRLPLQECIQIGLCLSQALGHLHRKGLVHRDIKPSNIIFVRGVPKLADVGLVTPVTEARSFVGTEGFIPPEGPGSPQADLYSLGIVLYVLSTGKSHQDFPEPLSDLSAQENHAQWLEFNAVMHKASQARAGDRFQAAEQMSHELALLKEGQSVKARRALKRGWQIALKLTATGVALALSIATWRLFIQSTRGHTPNPKAARLYELGRWHYSQLTPEAHVKALQYLSEATQADPKFVQPYGEWMMLYTFNMVPDSLTEKRRLEHVTEIANKAFAINPNAAEGHAALSWCKFLQRDWRGAETEIQRAISLNPNLGLAHAIYCFYLSAQCRITDALREGASAQALESPESQRVAVVVASWPYIAARRSDLAIIQLQRALDLDRNFLWGHSYLATCYEARSNYVAAIEEYRIQATLLGRDSAQVTACFDSLRRAYDEDGEKGYLRKWIELIRAEEGLPPDQHFFDGLGSDLVSYYARLGESDKALNELETHFDEPQWWHQIKFIEMYDPLHNLPRFKVLVKRAGLDP